MSGQSASLRWQFGQCPEWAQSHRRVPRDSRKWHSENDHRKKGTKCWGARQREGQARERSNRANIFQKTWRRVWREFHQSPRRKIDAQSKSMDLTFFRVPSALRKKRDSEVDWGGSSSTPRAEIRAFEQFRGAMRRLLFVLRDHREDGRVPDELHLH